MHANQYTHTHTHTHKQHTHTNTHKRAHAHACAYTHAHVHTHTHTYTKHTPCSTHQHTLMFRWWCSLHSAVPVVVSQWAQQWVPKLTEPPPSVSAVPQVCGPTREASTWLSLRSLGTGEDERGRGGKRQEWGKEREMSGSEGRDRARKGSGN